MHECIRTKSETQRQKMKGQVARNILRRKKCIQCQWLRIRKGVWVLLRREVNDKGHKKGYRTAFFNISLPWKQTAIRWPTLLSKGKNKEQEIHKSHNTGEFSVLRLNESQFLGGFTFDVYRGLQRIWKGKLSICF